MGDFGFYFGIGWQHIISLDALDHQLFLLVLTVLYTFKQWKQVLILVTAFTVGHSITLALSTLSIIEVSARWIEFFIPCTILITAVINIFQSRASQKLMIVNYTLALVFGLIHGLGFANTLKYMLASDQSLGWALLSFNLGVEVGQVVLVIFLLGLYHIIVNRLTFKQRYLIVATSILVIIVSLKMIADRFPL